MNKRLERGDSWKKGSKNSTLLVGFGCGTTLNTTMLTHSIEQSMLGLLRLPLLRHI